MKIIIATLLGICTSVGGYFGYQSFQSEPVVGGFSDPFISLQLAGSPQNGYILSTDGISNSWIANSGGGSGLFQYNSGTDTISPIIASTSNKASLKVSWITATSTASTSSFVNLDVTGTLTADLTGNADTATALAANGANCSSGNSPLGVDASGAVESCFDVWTEAENTAAAYLQNIVEDTTPQLGGTLDLNGQNISYSGASNLSLGVSGAGSYTLSAGVGGLVLQTSADNGNITINPHGTGDLILTDLTSGLLTVDGSGIVSVDASTYLTTVDISDNTNLVAGTNITLTGDTLNVDDAFLLNNGDIGTGVFDFGGATSFEIVNSTNPTVDADGEVAVDTTQDQFITYDGAEVDVLFREIPRSFGRIGSTSLDYTLSSFDTGTSTWSAGESEWAGEVVTIRAKTNAGTCLVRVGDGTNWTETVSANSSGASDTSLSNGTFTAFEEVLLQIGSCATSPDYVIPTIMWKETRQ